MDCRAAACQSSAGPTHEEQTQTILGATGQIAVELARELRCGYGCDLRPATCDW